MNALTHVYLSMVFKKAVENNLPVKLKTFSFIKGNLKPDFSLLLIKNPHYKIPTSDLVKKEMEKLIRQKPDKYNHCTGDFSERLGIVTHYLSDFFCYAHSTGFRGSVLDHYVYEKGLSRYRKSMKEKITELTGGSEYARSCPDFQSICNLLDRLHVSYQSKRPSYARDIAYTLKAGIPTAISLVLACIRMEPEQQAAA